MAACRIACWTLVMSLMAAQGSLGAGFEVAPVGGEAGVKATELVVVDFAQDAPGKLHEAKGKFVKVSGEEHGAVTESTWKSDVGNVGVKCVTKKTAAGVAFEVTITNGITHRIESLDIQLPQIRTPYDEANKIYMPFRGGRSIVWNQGEWPKGQGNSSVWPSSAFSPIVTLWNDRTQDTFAITFFNRALAPAIMFWFSGPTENQQHEKQQQLNPFLRLLPMLDPGQTLTVTADYAQITGGPAAHQKRYREETLAPFMKELSIPEAAGLQEKGPIAMCSSVEPTAGGAASRT